jgi:hypothetical protein
MHPEMISSAGVFAHGKYRDWHIRGKESAIIDFLEHADGKNSEANSNIFLADAIGFCVGELRHHLFVVQDGAGD